MTCPHCKEAISENHSEQHIAGCWKQERLRILAELQSAVCYCGGFKTARQTFCRREYNALPPDMRRALYRRFGDGYEEAYTAARVFLAPTVTMETDQ